jgi:hypothetical protein
VLSLLQWRNEWRLQSRNPLVWIALAIVAGFSLVVADGSPADPDSSATFALLRINLFIPAFMLPFLAGALGPLFYLRETDHGMAELFGAYAITTRQWLGIRLGNFTFLLVGACLIAQLGFVAVLAGDHPGQLLTMLGHSALWLVVLHLPACLIWTSGMAWLACRTAGSGFLYAAAGLGWMAYLAIASLVGLPLIAGSDVVFPAMWQAMLVLDPYGATAMISAPPESGLLQWREVNLAAGRIVWLAICLLVLSRIRNLPSHAARLVTSRAGAAEPAADQPELRLRWFDRVGQSHFAIHVRYFVRDRIFVILVGGWIALLLPEAYGGTDYAEELSRLVPDSRDALNRVVWDVVPIAGALLLLYAADRVCRLYPATRMNELYAATPHCSARLMAVQVVMLWAIALFFMVLAGLSIVAAQLLAGSAIQPVEYLHQLGLSLPVWLLLALLLTAIHGFIRLRVVANLACLLVAVLGFTNLAPGLGLEHPLWRPLATPLSEPDHYWGFAGSLTGHLRYLLFWLPTCLAAALLATAWHHRTVAFSPVPWRRAGRNHAALLAIPLVALAVSQGSGIDRTLRQEGLLVSTEDRARQRADYERRYADWAGRPHPDVDRIIAKVDFHAAGNRVELRAQLRLVNRTAGPITELLVGRNRLDRAGRLVLPGASILHRDAALGQTVYRFDQPLAPGGTIMLDFATELVQSGIEPAAFPYVLRRSFSSLPAHAVLPVIGFRRELTLRDPAIRRQQGLPELRLTPPSGLPAPAAGSLAPGLLELEALISTDADLHAIAQGDLVRQWRAGGRSHFLYRTTGPVRNHPVFYAVPWQPQVWEAGAVRIESYSPQPLGGDDLNVLAMRDTLAWLGHDIAPYPGKTLRLVAVPEIGPSGYAYPEIIEISHRLGFRAHQEPGAGFSQVYRRAAHETAHQRFGHLLGHGIPDENAFLVESLAKYAELVLIERRYGRKAMEALVQFERDRYRQARMGTERPVSPLIDAVASEDIYSRATLAFACLRSEVGDQPIIDALRRMAAQSRETLTPARSIDFVQALKAAVRPDLRRPLEDLFLARSPLAVQLVGMRCATK